MTKPFKVHKDVYMIGGAELSHPCEGHFGIYQPATAVERYIQAYLESL